MVLLAAFVGLSPDDAGGGKIASLFASVIQVKGGFVNLPIPIAKSKDGVGMENYLLTHFR